MTGIGAVLRDVALTAPHSAFGHGLEPAAGGIMGTSQLGEDFP